jgi:hypothetical protein
MRWMMRSCSACSSASAGEGTTRATMACGFRVPSEPTESMRTRKGPRRTRSSPWAISSAMCMSMSPTKRSVRW